MIRRPPRSTQSRSSAASDVYKRQAWYRDLIALRRREPDLASGARDGVVRHADDGSWLVVHRGAIRVAVNLSAGPASVPLDLPAGPGGIGPVEVLLAWDAVTVQGADAHLPGRSVAVIRGAGRL